jgi:multidrug efflux pump subunit AcrB
MPRITVVGLGPGPLLEVSSVENTLRNMRIRHLEHFRTISVQSFTQPGFLASEVFTPSAPKLKELENSLPLGYKIIVSGEQAKQVDGFKNLSVVMAISIAMIFLALAFQFKHSIKPILVLAAAPYGVAGALIALYIMGSPFGFMAFLGIASLIGVIVSHVIVLFDFIEEMHEKGEPLEQALLDAGIVRPAAGDDHCGRDDSGALPACDSRRAFVATALLCADRRAGRGNVHYAAACAGAVLDFCARSEDRSLGQSGRAVS